MTETTADRLHGSVDRAAQGAHHVIDRGAATAGPAIDSLRDKAMLAGDSIHAKMDDLSALQEEWMGAVRGQVRAHPLAVVAGALVLGLLIGRMNR